MTDVNLISAAQVNFKMYKGDSTFVTVAFTDVGVDLSSRTFKMQLRRASGAAVEKEFSTVDGIQLVGIDTLKIGSFADVAAGNMIYDLQETFTNGDILTLLFGTIIIRDDRTR